MKIHKCQQMSDEWFSIRLGKATSSHFSEVMNKKTGRRSYMYRLLGERLSGEPYEAYSNKAMERGSLVEEQARTYYEALYGEVEQVGFIELNENVGASTDGLVGRDGILEIKSPQPNTHVSYICTGRLPATYVPQVQGGLWVTGRQWCDFISFDPRIKQRPFWRIRVGRDEEYIANLAVQANKFVKEMLELEQEIIGSKEF